jgi:hypothetical protein
MKASNLIGGISVGISAQTANYTLTINDAGKRVVFTKGTAGTITVPPEATVYFDVGTVIEVEQEGVGAVTLTPGAAVTINVVATKTLVTAGRYSVSKLVKVGADTWTASGDLVAA